MLDDAYGLGIDIGDGGVTAAICRSREAGAVPEAWRLGMKSLLAPTSVELEPQGRLCHGNDPQEAGVTWSPAVAHVMDRVGTTMPIYLDGPRGGAVSAADVVAAIVRRVYALAESREGRPPGATVVTIPPSWGAHRRTVLAQALADRTSDDGSLEGLAEAAGATLVSGAVAATYHHIAVGDLPDDATVAVYDLGASTLDTAVVGPTEAGLDHLAFPPDPIRWAGRDIDDALLGHVLRWMPAPCDGQLLRERTVAAKEVLSGDTATVLELDTADPLRVTREELDELIAPRAEQSVDGLHEAISAAGLTTEDLDAVVLAGGSARVPLVAELVSAGLGRRLVVDPEPEAAAALGAARLAADGLLVSSEEEDDPEAQSEDRSTRVLRRAGHGDAVDARAGTADDPRGGDDVDGKVAHPAHPVRRPSRSDTAPGMRPPTARSKGNRRGARSGPKAGRVTGRAAVVGAAFLALVIIGPAMAAVFSSDIEPAPTDGVAEAGTEPPAPSDAPAAPEAGTSATGAMFAGVQVSAAAGSRPLVSSGTSGSSRAPASPGTVAGTAPSAAVVAPPAAGSPTTSAPGPTPGTTTPAGTPLPSSTPAPGTTTPPPTTQPPTTPPPTTPPPTTPPPTTPPPTTQPPTQDPEPPAPEPEPTPEPTADPAPDPGTGSTDSGAGTSEVPATPTAAEGAA